MVTDSPFLEVGADDFARRFSMRAGRLAWLLGAGASAASGVPTAADMVWEFKQQLYVSQRRVSPRTVRDLANHAIRNQLQSYFDGEGRYPRLGDSEEYAAFFEAAYPSEADRRTYIDGKLSGAKPCFGQLALATLMKAGLTKMVWTTNFDPMIADACAVVFGGTGALTSVALDAPDLAQATIAAQRWPVEVKLHGDFRSRRLKNTGDELRQQDARLRQQLVRACLGSGLVVAGYSGRDESIMDALVEALAQQDCFPGGLFWLHRGDDPVLPRVADLLAMAANRGVDGGLVRIESFDECMRDLIRLIQGLDCGALDDFAFARRRWTAPVRISGQRGWPLVRLNAIEVSAIPIVCRRVVCSIGGMADVRAAIERTGVDLLATRSRAGVLAFGRDEDARAAFGAFNIADFDLHPIEHARLRFDSAERGLLRDAITRAVARSRELDHTRRRSADLLAPHDPSASKWQPLRTIVGQLAGEVKSQIGLRWREGVSIRLDWGDERLWLLMEPRTVFDGLTEENRTAATDFARERSVTRYNQRANALIEFWADALADGGAELRALSVSDGVDAVFRLATTTAYSRRVRS